MWIDIIHCAYSKYSYEDYSMIDAHILHSEEPALTNASTTRIQFFPYRVFV